MDLMIMIVVTKRQTKCGKMCGKIEKLLDWNKNLCGSKYGPCDYDSGDKKTKRQKDKKDNNKKQKQKDKKDKQKKTKRQGA